MRDARTTIRLASEEHAAEPSEGALEGPTHDVRWSRVLAVSLGFLVIFYTVEHNPADFAGLQVADVGEDRIKDTYIDSIEDGNAMRKLVITSYGLAGLAALVLCRGREWNVRRSGAALLGVFLLWTLTSVLWSVEPSLTFRRLVASGLILVGSLGFARMLRPMEVLTVALLTFAAFVGNSLLMDLGGGGRPWAGDYRFGGTLHPNIQAAYCGMLCLAAFAFPAQTIGARWAVRGLCAFGFLMLLQTQSRTSALAVLVGFLMVFMVRLTPRIRWWAAAVMVCLAALTTILVSSQSDGGRKRLTNAVLLGRTEQAGSLTGRVPLWQELSGYASQRPLVGYGYESFWTPDVIAAVMKSQNWALQSAHNAYFEVRLQLGWIGLVLALAMLAGGFNLLQSAYSYTANAGYAFGYGVMAFAMTNSLLESHFSKLKYPTVIALIALLSVLVFFPVSGGLRERLRGPGRVGGLDPVRARGAGRKDRDGEVRRSA